MTRTRKRVGHVRRDPRLTEEQDAMRLGGLRILARMIARAHLASLAENTEKEGVGCAGSPGRSAAPDGDLPQKEGGHVR